MPTTAPATTKPIIPIARPWLDAEEERAVLEPLRTGWVVQGPKVRAFEQALAAYTGSPHVVAVSSCTAALHLSLLAAGVGPGDEVILPSFTFIATANVVERCGARPVLIDIDLETFNLDARALEAAVRAATKAVIPVHLFGLGADLAAVDRIASRRKLAVIEDAACGIGAQDRGRHLGTLAEFGSLSFHARKIITTGEGGAVLTPSAERAAQIRSLREHGANVDDFKRHATGQMLLPEYPLSGLNYRMTDLQAAIGLAQLQTKLVPALERRRALAARYTERLARLDWLRTPTAPSGFTHAFQSYVCLYQPREPIARHAMALRDKRQALMQRLRADGIETRQGTHAVHLLAYYAATYGFRPDQFPNAYVADHATLALPLYPQMTDEEQDRVIEALLRLGP